MANYDEILLPLRKSFAELAEDSAKRLDATLEIPVTRKEFVATVVAHAVGMVPTRSRQQKGKPREQPKQSGILSQEQFDSLEI